MFLFTRRLLLTLILFSVISSAFAQVIQLETENEFISIHNLTKEKYGVDPLLLNGIYYENPYYNAEGHPFLGDGNFHIGYIIFRNKRYDGISMKYDIYNQQMIIKQKQNKPMVMNLLAGEFVSEFSINDKYFEKIVFEDSGPAFYQVLTEEKDIICYYFWDKKRYKEHDEGERVTFIFSESKYKSYLLIDGKLLRFRNNRSFVKLFPDKVKSQIRNYLRSNSIKLSEADDPTMKELMHFCQIALNKSKL